MVGNLSHCLPTVSIAGRFACTLVAATEADAIDRTCRWLDDLGRAATANEIAQTLALRSIKYLDKV
jgi:hypothetical protein